MHTSPDISEQWDRLARDVLGADPDSIAYKTGSWSTVAIPLGGWGAGGVRGLVTAITRLQARITASIAGKGTAKAAANAGTRSIDNLLRPGGTTIGKAGTDDTIRDITGGRPEAEAMFHQLSHGGTVVAQTPKLTRVELPNSGGFVQLRTVMSRSPNTAATIDVNIPGFDDITKLKYNP